MQTDVTSLISNAPWMTMPASNKPQVVAFALCISASLDYNDGYCIIYWTIYWLDSPKHTKPFASVSQASWNKKTETSIHLVHDIF